MCPPARRKSPLEGHIFHYGGHEEAQLSSDGGVGRERDFDNSIQLADGERDDGTSRRGAARCPGDEIETGAVNRTDNLPFAQTSSSKLLALM